MADRISVSLNKELDAKLRTAAGIIHAGASAALLSLATGSPIWSGYYQRNHRVRRVNRFPVEPSSQPEDKKGSGSLALDPGALLDREQEFIRRFKIGDQLYIGNGVPYAQEIEDGTKTMPQGNFYGQAALVFRSTIERLRGKI